MTRVRWAAQRVWVLAAAALLVGVGVAASAGAAPPPTPRVRVKGTARIDAHAARAAGRLVVSGTVVDDTARPIAGAHLAVGVDSTRSPDAHVGIPLAGASPEPCSEGGPRPVLERADLLTVPTDDAARFCVRMLLPTDRYVVHLESRATGLVEAAKLDLPVDLARAPVTLRFDPERPGIVGLSLDEEEAGAASVMQVVASTEDDGVTTAAVGIALTLTNEAGAVLGTAATDASGRARFAVEPARLGPPGRGELRVAFAGGADGAASSQAMQVERRTRVDLAAPDATEGHLPPGSPEDGIAVRVVATARCARRGCTTLPTGTVEARPGEGDGSAIAGAASLEQGQAHMVATFAMPPANEAGLRLRYVPDAPWFLPGGELALVVPVRAPSPWTKAPLVLLALVAVAWLAIPRLLSRVRPAPTGDRPSRAPAIPEAGVALVRAGPAARGWTGRLHDAHDGFAIVAARVAIERRGFERVERLVEVATDDDGAFVLPPLEAQPGDELFAEGLLHAPLRRPLPPAGELDVALVLRRRALLDRLVAWARKRGKPFDARPEPTPGQVRRAAGSEFTVARWADAVERAAFGGEVVDERAEGEVDRLAPPPPPPEPVPAPAPLGPPGRGPGDDGPGPR